MYDGQLIDSTILQTLPCRATDSNKGNFGTAGLLGGAPGMVGAVLLAARAALHLGAGKVYAASLDHRIALDFGQPEIMLVTPAQLLTTPLTVMAVGPGLGQTDEAHRLLAAALQSTAVLVLDADALNLLAASPHLKSLTRNRSAPTLLTPHPGEAARLLGCDVPAVQADRTAAVLRLVEHYRARVVLKGANSICAAPGGAWRVNPTGNPGLASAGMGDALTGMVAALLAQQLEPFVALQLAVYLHGAAADSLLASGAGPVGLSASEVPVEARRLLNQAGALSQ